MEPWITPSMFANTGNDAIVDETLLVALSALQTHWETWITEDDFVAIAAAGLNHVRIPVGYWSVPLTSADTKGSTSVEPYVPGAWPYLLKGLNWAKKHGIHVILGLARRPRISKCGPPARPISRGQVDTLRYIAANIGGLVDVIELLNEPATFLSSTTYPATLRQFWLDGYDAVRSAAGQGIKVMIGDGFMGVNSWTNFLTSPSQGVIMDYHEYQIFSIPELSRSYDEHITAFATSGLVSASDFICTPGEWSNAVTDCTQWLNGRGVGARWDGTYFGQNQALGSCDGWSGSYKSFSSDYKTFLRKYWEVQVMMGEKVQGWVYWTWKAENSDEWSYQKGLEGGWIPTDPSDRMYPNICS
ncbi:glycoside hydrolase family 5 protein [Mycena rebaudengoi]|nr:glycoside hydrolase family 5 protein [Mycena rebaudengoi]